LGRDAAQYLTQFQAKIKREFEELGKPAEFAIDIGYKLALVQKPGDADIVLTKGETGTRTQIVQVPKDPSKTHPYRQKEVVEQVNAALNGAAKINRYDIQCVVKVHEVRKRPEFYYKGTVKGSPVQYSYAFVEWLLRQYRKDSTFFTQVRQKAKSKQVAHATIDDADATL